MDIRILILQRGFVYVGRYERIGESVLLHGARNIHRWGTTKGLGELINGPLNATVLHPAGEVEAHFLTTIASLRCNPEKWADHVG
jgi:hypothetical protein